MWKGLDIVMSHARENPDLVGCTISSPLFLTTSTCTPTISSSPPENTISANWRIYFSSLLDRWFQRTVFPIRLGQRTEYLV